MLATIILNMKQELKILIFILAIFAVLGCVSQTQTQTQARQDLIVDFTEYKVPLFSIKYPANWSQVSHAGFVVAFEDLTGENEASLAVSRSVQDSFTPESAAISEKQYQSANYPEYSIISEGLLVVSDSGAYKRVYKWHDAERGNITQMKFWIKNDDNVLYTIVATSLTGKFQGYEPIFTWVVDSFKIN